VRLPRKGEHDAPAHQRGSGEGDEQVLRIRAKLSGAVDPSLLEEVLHRPKVAGLGTSAIRTTSGEPYSLCTAAFTCGRTGSGAEPMRGVVRAERIGASL
jgi:hypothetical protein